MPDMHACNGALTGMHAYDGEVCGGTADCVQAVKEQVSDGRLERHRTKAAAKVRSGARRGGKSKIGIGSLPYIYLIRHIRDERAG